MSNWSEDRVETLKNLWQEGLSAAQVAAALGGVTRNAVIGKVHRLGLAERADASRSSSSRPRLPRASRPRGIAAAKAIVPVVVENPFTFADGSFATMRSIDKAMCRWPIGDPKQGAFHFCGRDTKEGSPYCGAHAVRAHQPHKKRKAPPMQRANMLAFR